MPRPEQTPSARFEGLPYGANSLANEMSAGIEEPTDDGVDELEGWEPASDAESFLFSQSDRPGEPVTAGMSFGEGPNVSRFSYEGPEQFKQRIAQTLATPTAPKEVRAFVSRLERGY